MQCPECAAEVSALREFCPHCGTPMRGSLRSLRTEGPSQRPDEELQRNRRRVVVIGVAILLAMGVAGKISWFPGTIHFESRDHRPKGPVVIEAQQVYDAYRDNARAAKKRFRGREMVVSGEFVRIVPDGNGNPDLRLKTSDPEQPLGVDLVQLSYDQAARLQPGQRVTVSCQRITGSDDDRWLQNCAIQAPDGSPPPSSASKSPSPPAAAEANKS